MKSDTPLTLLHTSWASSLPQTAITQSSARDGLRQVHGRKPMSTDSDEFQKEQPKNSGIRAGHEAIQEEHAAIREENGSGQMIHIPDSGLIAVSEKLMQRNYEAYTAMAGELTQN